MIRRMFKLDASHYENPTSLELIVTYDPSTGTLNVGHREHGYDEWSRPIEEIDRQDDQAGRLGGIGSVRGESSVIERLRAIVLEHDQASAEPVAVPADQLDAPDPGSSTTSDE